MLAIEKKKEKDKELSKHDRKKRKSKKRADDDKIGYTICEEDFMSYYRMFTVQATDKINGL